MLLKILKPILIFLIVYFLNSCNTYESTDANFKINQFYVDHKKEITDFILYTKNLGGKDSIIRINYLSKGSPHLQAFKSDGRKTDFLIDQKFEYFFSDNHIAYLSIKDSIQVFHFYKVRNKNLNGLELVHFEKPIIKTEDDSIDGVQVVVGSNPKIGESYYYKIDDNWYIFSKKTSDQ